MSKTDVTRDLSKARRTQAFQLLKLITIGLSEPFSGIIHTGKIECVDGSELEFFETGDAAILVPPISGEEPT
jgi:hypothetical protein